MASPVLAQVNETYVANQKTVAWLAVTELEDGTPIPAEDTVTYDVFLQRQGTAEETQVADNVSETSATVTFPDGIFYVGVRAVRGVLVEGVLYEVESDMSWSNDPTVCLNGITFRVRNHLPPGQVKGLEAQ